MDYRHRSRGKLRVLVPGAGLGRLAWDVAALGGSYIIGIIEGSPVFIPWDRFCLSRE